MKPRPKDPECKFERLFHPEKMDFKSIYGLRRHYALQSAGYQEFLRYMLACCYGICDAIRDDKAKLAVIRNKHFFKGMHQPPDDNDVTKWVVFFVMKAKHGNKRDRAGRHAAILKRYLDERLSADQVEQRLQDEGGIVKAQALSAKGSSGPKAQIGSALGISKRATSNYEALTGNASDLDENEGEGEVSVNKNSSSRRSRPKTNKDDLKVITTKRLLRKACKKPGRLIIYAMATPNPEKGVDWMDIEATRIKHRSA